MDPRRSPLGRKYISFGILLMVAAGAILYLSLVWSSGPSTYSSKAFTIDTSLGLRLQLTLNSSVLKQGDAMVAKLDVINVVGRPRNLSASNEWPLPYLTLSGDCGSYHFPYGVGLLKGYYVSANVSTGTPLRVFSPHQPNPKSNDNCPLYFPEITYFVFEPNKDVATLVFPYSDRSPVPMNWTIALDGAYTGGSFQTFQPGIYTLALGDEWGQLVLVHFAVKQA